MLKIKLNRSNYINVDKVEVLKKFSIIEYDGEVYFYGNEPHDLLEKDIVTFKRDLGFTTSIENEREISILSEYSFKIDSFDDLKLMVKRVSLLDNVYMGNNTTKTFVNINLLDGYRHYYTKITVGNILQRVSRESDDLPLETDICNITGKDDEGASGYVLYGNLFLREIDDVDYDENKFITSKELSNVNGYEIKITCDKFEKIFTAITPYNAYFSSDDETNFLIEKSQFSEEKMYQYERISYKDIPEYISDSEGGEDIPVTIHAVSKIPGNEEVYYEGDDDYEYIMLGNSFYVKKTYEDEYSYIAAHVDTMIITVAGNLYYTLYDAQTNNEDDKGYVNVEEKTIRLISKNEDVSDEFIEKFNEVYNGHNGVRIGGFKGDVSDNRMYKPDRSLMISVPFSYNINNDLLLDNYIEDNYIEDISKKYVNEIVDYEKIVFEPVLYNGSDEYNKEIEKEIETNDNGGFLGNVDELEFNVLLRPISDETDYNETTLVTRYKNHWYNSILNDDEKLNEQDEITYNCVSADLLGGMGISYSDIYNRSKKLKKSFLRLLFYDSKNTDRLVFYSTIFLNADDLYGKFVTNINYYKLNGIEMDDLVTLDINDGNRLGITFKVANKFNKDCCSEGFYLYLHQNTVSGYCTNNLFLKIEFNNAVTGDIVPLIPLLKPVNRKYTSEEIGGTNYYEYLNDLYTPVKIKYDAVNERYVWYLPYSANKLVDVENNPNKIILNLFQPVILFQESEAGIGLTDDTDDGLPDIGGGDDPTENVDELNLVAFEPLSLYDYNGIVSNIEEIRTEANGDIRVYLDGYGTFKIGLDCTLYDASTIYDINNSSGINYKAYCDGSVNSFYDDILTMTSESADITTAETVPFYENGNLIKVVKYFIIDSKAKNCTVNVKYVNKIRLKLVEDYSKNIKILIL